MNILVGYDMSDASRKALGLAKTYAQSFGGKVYVVLSMGDGRDVPENVVTRADDDLEQVRVSLEEAGVSCETHLLARGLEPGEDIVRFAEEKKIDHMVIGIRKKSRVQKLVFGSNAQFIILNAPCPVVTVK